MKVKRIIEIEEGNFERICDIVELNKITSKTPKDMAYLAIAQSKPYGCCYDCKKNLEEETHVDCFECSHHYRDKFDPKEGEATNE